MFIENSSVLVFSFSTIQWIGHKVRMFFKNFMKIRWICVPSEFIWTHFAWDFDDFGWQMTCLFFKNSSIPTHVFKVEIVSGLAGFRYGPKSILKCYLVLSTYRLQIIKAQVDHFCWPISCFRDNVLKSWQSILTYSFENSHFLFFSDFHF